MTNLVNEVIELASDLGVTPEISEDKREYLDTNQKHEVDSYPYGRLRTTAYFWVEFKPKKGMRNGFQTINPKTNNINKPKYGTYDDLSFQFKDAQGHIKNDGMNIHGFEDINKVAKFLTDNWDALNLKPEIVEFIYGRMYATMKGNAAYVEKGNLSALMEIIKPTVRLILKGFKSGDNLFPQINLDINAINKLYGRG